MVADIVVVLLLYQLLKPVNKNLAALMVILNLPGVVTAMLNELNQFAIPLLLRNADALRAFTPDQLYALVSLFLNCTAPGVSSAGYSGVSDLFPTGCWCSNQGSFPD